MKTMGYWLKKCWLKTLLPLMKSIQVWMKMHFLKSLFISLGLVLALVAPPLIIHGMYKKVAQNPYFISTWSSGDLLTYIAGFEAFVGTLFLGLVALKQNDKANKLNEKLVKIQEEQGIFERQPEISIDTQSIHIKDKNELYNKIRCTFNSKDFFEKLNLKEFDEEDIFIFVFKLRNESKFRVISEIGSLQLSNTKESFILEFDNMPMIYKTYPLLLESETEDEVAFIIKPSEIKYVSNVEGVLSINLRNPIDEIFVLNVHFSIYVYKTKGLFIRVSDHKVKKQDSPDHSSTFN